MRPPVVALLRTGLPSAAGLAALLLAGRGLGARGDELAQALTVWALAALPVGALLGRRIARDVWTLPVERIALSALLGLPASSFVGYLAAAAGFEAVLPALAVLAAGVWAAAAWRSGETRLDWAHPANGVVALLAGLGALVLTRGLTAFRASPDGTLTYDHTLEHAIHIAFSWELLRGLPAAQLPTAAGLPFPHYHWLGYVPLTWAARYGGVGLITVHHALVPPLALALLTGAAHLAVKARTARHLLSAATIVTLLFVVTVLERLLVPYTFRGRVPLEMLVRSVSAGAGILLFATVAALLATVRTREDARPLVLAGALVGLAYGVKAQMFLMLGGAFALMLVLLAARGWARPALASGGALLACALPLALVGREDTRLGRLHFVPGLFARECELAPLFAELGPTALWLLGSPLALWSILRFSPLVPAFAFVCLRRWRRSPPVDLFLALAVATAAASAYGLAAEEMQRGAISTLVVREALFAVQVLAVGVDVGVIGWLLARLRVDGARAAAVTAGLCAAALLPWTGRTSLHQPLPNPLALRPAEVGALEHLRQHAPLDAVVAHLRGAVVPELAARFRGLHPVPVVAALAGRRTVLEYYRPDVDPSASRLRVLRRVFATPDAAEAEVMLDRYGVDYVLEYALLPLRFRSPRLALVYERDGVRLWRVGREDAGVRPAAAYAPPGLR